MLGTRFDRTTLYSVLLLFVWCGVIFAFSSMPGSGAFFDPPLWYILERKSAHVFEYAVLASLAYRCFARFYPRETFARLGLLTAVFALTYGVSDELHQAFVFGRGSQFTDVAIDGIGIGLALTFIALRQSKTPSVRS